MLFYSNKYLYNLLQRKIIGLVLLMFFSMAAYAQNTLLTNNSLFILPASPVVVSISKKPVQLMTLHIKPAYKPYFVKRGGELIHWPNYPLTAGQIIARQEQWQRRNDQSFGQKVAGDIANEIVRNKVNALIYGKKMPVAVVPRF
jgi:hypothetical protein